MLKNYLTAALLVFLFSCQEKKDIVLPEPEFEIIDVFGYKPEIFAVKEMVQVESVTQADSYFWEFGDGETSREKKPTHVYQEPGIYTLRLTIRSGDAVRTVLRLMKVGSYYVEEVRLINYTNSFWVDGRKTDVHPVSDATDLYMTVNEFHTPPSNENHLFKSKIFEGMKKETLPLRISIPEIRMDNRRFDKRIDFFAKSDNDEEGIVASNYFVTSSTTYFYPETNEGYITVGRGTTPGDGFDINVHFRRKMPN